MPEDAYSSVAKGNIEPEAARCNAGHARFMGMEVPAEVPDGTLLIITREGWEVYE